MKYISKILCIMLITALCLESLMAQESRTGMRQRGFSACPTLSKSKTNASPASKGMVKVTLIAEDVWMDGSGYQMLLDANANTYGVIIPASGPLTNSGDANEDDYAEFEYKIPEEADWLLTTQMIVIDNSITIEIPSGTYDYCITNPVPGDRMWIASGDYGRYDDFVFEDGLKYEFTITYDYSTDKDKVTLIVEDDVIDNPCPEINNLWARVQGSDVALTWDAAPDSPTGYKVYDGITLLGTTKNTSYMIRDLSEGEHVIGIAAQYDDVCTPKKVTATVIIQLENPVEHLTVTEAGDCKAALVWEAPRTSQWIGYAGENVTGIGYGINALFTVAARWDPDDLAEMGIESGAQITKISIVPWYTSTATFALRIYQGGTSQNDAGTLLYEQPLVSSSLQEAVENEIVLDAPFEIDASQELRIGYRVQASSGYPAGCDEGPTAVAGKSDLIFFNGAWYQFADLNPSMPINWNIKGHLLINGKETKLGYEARSEVDSYDIYCDDEKIGNTANLNYEYTVRKGGSHDFCVVALYDDDAQSPKTCETVYVNCSTPCEPPINVMATVNTTSCEATLTWDGEGTFRVTKNGLNLGEQTSPYIEVIEPGEITYCVIGICTDDEYAPVCANEVDCSVGINELKTLINIYPNPTTGEFKIKRDGLVIKNVRVFDMTGRLLYAMSDVNNTEVDINLTNFSNGIYFLNIDGKTVKVIKL